MSEPTRTLLEWVLQRYPDTPRTRAKQWIEAGRVQIDGRSHHRASEVLSDPGARLQLLSRHEAILDCTTAWTIHPRLSLLYLDSSLALVNKGPGLLSVPAGDASISALSVLDDFLAGRLPSRHAGTVPPVLRRLRPMPVHRLDQHTSGLLCFAMNPTARARLIDQVRRGRFTRDYVAYVEGRPKTPRGTWRHRLELSEDEWEQKVVPGRPPSSKRTKLAEAITHYEVEREYLSSQGLVVTKLRVRLETGLRHQIRVQAAREGMPIVGDRRYHPAYDRRKRQNTTPVVDFERQALHATRLELEHPQRLGTRLAWNAPLPGDLVQLEKNLASGRR